MMRHFSGITVLLVLAIVFIAGVLFTRTRPPQVEDQVADSVKELYDAFGFQVAGTVGPQGGLDVERVKSGSVAERLGIKKGDRVITVNDRSVWHAKDMADQLFAAVNAGPAFMLVANGDNYRQVVLGGRRGASGTPGAGRGGPGRGGRMRAPAGATRGQGTPQPPGSGAPARGR
jgi:membrane-associated protease RseP (regulator of RpoE activity)